MSGEYIVSFAAAWAGVTQRSTPARASAKETSEYMACRNYFKNNKICQTTGVNLCKEYLPNWGQ